MSDRAHRYQLTPRLDRSEAAQYTEAIRRAALSWVGRGLLVTHLPHDGDGFMTRPNYLRITTPPQAYLRMR